MRCGMCGDTRQQNNEPCPQCQEKPLTLLQAARVFSFIVPEGMNDDEIIGQIRSTLVYAGEMRRLNAAIAAEEARKK